jgi:bifunctional non-homologous end joining protein LigD
VLKSWAVPKGPSLDPSQKRLAVHVEDHPLSYASFKGTIPEGQYGAGEVLIWDHGTYDNLLEQKPSPQTVSEGIDAGRLEFTLHGEKLHGRFALVRMHGKRPGKENWLLIKMKDEFAQPDTGAPTKPRRATTSHRAVKKPTANSSPGGVEFTHVDKVLFPDAKITKGDVLEYYLRVSPWLLSYLQDRPITLERLPDGIGEGAPHFWQKNLPASAPDWIARIELPSERGKPVDYALINDERTLLYFVNQGALTFHTWFSRVQDLDTPDFVLFDLDRGNASFADVVAVAHELHGVLDAEEHEAFVKTSGKTGLHVLVSWRDGGDYDAARAWALEIAERVVHALPDTATTERSKSKRGKRVYVDVMQNARGHHAVPPYVVRPIPGAPVSMPLAWHEVTAHLDPGRFNLKTGLRRLARQKGGPMARLLTVPRSVARGH